jgi:hypothetical protein
MDLHYSQYRRPASSWTGQLHYANSSETLHEFIAGGAGSRPDLSPNKIGQSIDEVQANTNDWIAIAENRDSVQAPKKFPPAVAKPKSYVVNERKAKKRVLRA